jgi:tetratricopeptide (TPR) repeat protein
MDIFAPNVAETGNGRIRLVTSLLQNAKRPWTAALLLTAVVVPLALAASPIRTAQSDPLANFNFLPNFRASVTGSFMAGQQALQDLRTDEAARYFSQAAREDWNNPLIVERSFIALAADGQIGDAAGSAKRLLELDPRNQLAQLVVATEALKERRYAAADRLLSPLGRDSFVGITASVLRGWALIADNKAKEADELLQSIGKGGLDDFLIFHRALMAEYAGETDRALSLAEKAYSADPLVARVVELYVRILGNAGDFDAALDVLAEYEAQGASHPVLASIKEKLEAKQRPGVFTTNIQVGAAEMFFTIGVLFSSDAAFDLALVFLRLATYLDPAGDVTALTLGQLLDTAKQHDAANAIYETIPQTSPMKPSAIVRVAQNLDAKGDRKEAIRRLKNIAVSRPDDLEAVSVLGDTLRFDEQYLPAADAYTKALEITGGTNRADWRFYYVRGIAYERAKEWPKAEADLLKALELNPDNPSVLNYLGYSWIDQDMHLDRALGMIEKAVAAQPQDGYIVDSLGWAFYKLGRIEEAVKFLEQAVLLRPSDPELNDHLGDAYWKAGRKLEARFQWKIAASVDTIGTVKQRTVDKIANGLTDNAG